MKLAGESDDTADAATDRDDLEEARAAARRSEQELGRALQRLERSIRDPFAIADRIKESPVPWLAGAFVVGLVLARAARGDRR